MNKIKLFFHDLIFNNKFIKPEKIDVDNKTQKINNDSKDYSVHEVVLTNRKKIKLLTYNFFLRPLVATNENDFKLQRLIDFLDEVHEFDIICFQEAFGFVSNRKEKLIYEAAKRGFYYYVDHPEPSLVGPYIFDGGLVIISRFKIEETDFYPFTYGCDIDACINRGLLYAKIKVLGVSLHIITTHLQASYYHKSEERLLTSYLVRKSQIEEFCSSLEKVIKKYVKSNEKVICVGDFNVPAGEIDNKKLLYGIYDNEYDFFFNELNSYSIYKVKNIFPEEKGYFPHTYGGPDVCLYHKEDRHLVQALDYIFEVIPDFSVKNLNEKNLQIDIDYNSIKIEPFYLSDEKRIERKREYTILSDHKGLSIDLYIK